MTDSKQIAALRTEDDESPVTTANEHWVDVTASSRATSRTERTEGRRVGRDQPRPFWSSERFVVVVRLAADLISIFEALLIASYLRFIREWFEVTEFASSSSSTHLAASAVWMVAVLGTAAANRLYDEDTLTAGQGEPSRIIRSVLEATALLAIFVVFTRTFSISRSWFALVAVLSVVLLVIERLAIRKLLASARKRGRNRRPALLISKSGSTWPPEFVHELDEFDVVAHIDDVALRRYLSVGNRRDERRRTPHLWNGAVFIVRASEFDEDELWRLVMHAGQSGSAVFLHSSVRSVGRDRLTVRDISGHTMVRISPPRLRGVQAFQKRVLDIVGSFLLLMAISPLLFVITLAVLISSGRPIFFGQDRLGKDGQIFKMWKFRTMRVDRRPGADMAYATPGDPRRTRVGSILRRTSLDELPQIWNVLRGDMSLVGPRPEMATFAMRYVEEMPWYRYRHRIRPGITGLAQVSGLRGVTGIAPRAEVDNWYIEHWNPTLDLQILVRTVWEVFQGDHAY